MTDDSALGPPQQPRDDVGRSFLALGSGEIIGRLLSFAAVVHVSRTVGPEAWGVVALAAAITLYMSKLVDFGIETVGPNEVATKPAEVATLVTSLLAARLLIAVLLIVVGGGLVLLFLRGVDRLSFLAYFLTLLPLAASTRWVYLGLHTVGPVAIWRTVGESLVLAIALLAVHQSADVWKLPGAIVLGDGLAVTALALLLVKRGYRFHLRWDRVLAKRVMLRALPVMTQIILGLAIYNSDLIFLRALRTNADVGLYAAAYTLVGFAANVSVAYGMSLLPSLARLPRGGPEERAVYHTALLQSAVVAVPAFIGGAFVARDLVPMVFGSQYAESGGVLQILLISIPFSTARLVAFCALVAHAGQRSLVRAMIYAVLTNATLNVVLIKPLGPLGAAWSTAVTEALLCVLLLRYGTTVGLGFPPVSRFWRLAAACAAMSAVLLAVSGQPLLARVGIGAGAFALALVALGAIVFRKGIPSLNV